MPRPALLLTLALAVLVWTPAASSAQAQSGAQEALNARGAHAMGFDQERTVHHFRLYDDGGAIEIAVKDAADAVNRDAIRAHLPHIAMLFGQGQLDLPHFIHATDVPGTAELARLKAHVAYTYEETALGGRLNIVTTHREALAALHAFLRFQITDHETGDTLEVARRGGR